MKKKSNPNRLSSSSSTLVIKIDYNDETISLVLNNNFFCHPIHQFDKHTQYKQLLSQLIGAWFFYFRFFFWFWFEIDMILIGFPHNQFFFLTHNSASSVYWQKKTNHIDFLLFIGLIRHSFELFVCVCVVGENWWWVKGNEMDNESIDLLANKIIVIDGWLVGSEKKLIENERKKKNLHL